MRVGRDVSARIGPDFSQKNRPGRRGWGPAKSLLPAPRPSPPGAPAHLGLRPAMVGPGASCGCAYGASGQGMISNSGHSAICRAALASWVARLFCIGLGTTRSANMSASP